MGKYSLENFERYKAVKLRPEEMKEEAVNLRCGCFRRVDCTLSGNLPALADGTTLLSVTDDLPGSDLSCKTAALCRLGAALADDPRLLGVTFTTAETSSRLRFLLTEVCHSFRPLRLFVPVDDGAVIHQLALDGLPFGLLANMGGDLYDVCEAFAAGGLQKLWQRVPVLAEGVTEDNAAYARGWHALAGDNAAVDLGWHIALRRLTYPASLASNGYAPMRFWWANTGVSPCYEPLTARLRLRIGERLVPLTLRDTATRFDVGDRAFNEIIRLPELPVGAWALEGALTDAAGTPVLLAQRGRLNDGWYDLGTMTIDDQPHPELAAAWDDYYPDGYYPLEDPAQPE